MDPIKSDRDLHEVESNREVLTELAEGIIAVLQENATKEKDAFESYAKLLNLRIYEEKTFREHFVKGYEVLMNNLPQVLDSK